jgi:hypothetical protein
VCSQQRRRRCDDGASSSGLQTKPKEIHKYRETTNKKENEMRSCLSSSSFLIYKYSLSVVWIVVWIAPVGYVSSAAAQKESQMS